MQSIFRTKSYNIYMNTFSAHVHSRYPNIPPSSTFSTIRKKRNLNPEYMALDIEKAKTF